MKLSRRLKGPFVTLTEVSTQLIECNLGLIYRLLTGETTLLPGAMNFREPFPFFASTIHQASSLPRLILNLKTPLIFFTSFGPSYIFRGSEFNKGEYSKQLACGERGFTQRVVSHLGERQNGGKNTRARARLEGHATPADSAEK